MSNIQTEQTVEEIEAGFSDNPYVRSHILIKRSSGEGQDIPLATGNYLKRFSSAKTERRADTNHPAAAHINKDLSGQAVMPGFTTEAENDDASAPRAEREVRYYKAEILPQNVRSDRLRRIADTAFYDIRAEMENQLSFTQPEDTSAPNEEQPSGKKTIVTAGEILSAVPGNTEKRTSVRAQITSFAEKLRHSGQSGRTAARPAEVPCESRDDIPRAIDFYAKRRRRTAVKIIVLAVLFLLTAGLSAVFALSQRSSAYISTGLYAVISLIFLSGAAAACSSELLSGAKALFSGRLNCEAGIPVIYIAAFLQSAALFFAPDDGAGFCLVSPAVIFVMIAFSAGESLMDEQAIRILSRVGKGDMLFLRRADMPGIESGMSDRYAGKNKYLLFGKRTDFVDSPSVTAANAVPDFSRTGAVNVTAFLIALVGGVISGMYASSIIAGLTVAGAILCAGLPVLSRLTPTARLLSANRELAENRCAVFTYSDACEANDSSAVALTETALIDRDGCIIHNIKAVNNADVHRALILCAAAMKSCGSPLAVSAATQAGVSPDKLPKCKDMQYHDEGCVMTCEGHRLFIGSERLMSDNAIQIPLSLDYFDIITGDRRLLFFALDKKIALVLSVSYHIRMSAKESIYELVKSGRRVAAAVFDPNLTAEMISGRSRVSKDDVSRMRAEESLYLRNCSGKPTGSAPGAALWDGTAKGMSALLASCKRLAKIVPVSAAAGVISSILLSVGIFAVSLIFGSYAAVIAAPAAIILCRAAESAAVRLFT